MTENAADTCPLLPLEEVAQAVHELSAEPTLEGFAARFLARVRRWAAPSAVLTAVRDPGAESGWRLLPALCAGSGPLGAERSVQQLVDELPKDLAAARLVKPEPEVAGAKVRANCVLPWAWESASGVLVLRGVSGGGPANLADAVALLGAAVWPRVIGGPAERVESGVAELRRLAERLREEADRQVERLQAARPSAPEPPVDAGRVAELERQLAEARAVAERLAPLAGRVPDLERQLSEARAEAERHAPLSGRVPDLERQLAEARAEAERLAPLSGRVPDLERQLAEARAEAERLAPLSGRVPDLERELAAVRSEAERLVPLSGRVPDLEGQLAEARAEAQRLSAQSGRVPELEQHLAAARGEIERLSGLVHSLRSEDAAARLEGQRAAVDARAEARAAKESLVEAREAEARLKALVEQLQSEKASAAWRREEERAAEEKQAEAAKAAVRAAEEGLAASRQELANAEASVARLIVEREELRQQVTTLEKALGEAEEERDEIHRETTRLESRLQALGAAPPPAAEAPASGPTPPPPPAGESLETLRRALAVMRRTPYLPPMLRVAAQEAEAAAGSLGERKEHWARVVILDRDVAALEPLAGQLESAGLEVKIAGHPEELALLLKTPEGREVDAAICDVVAFRADQNVAGIFRGWDKDRPGLALYLSFARDSPPEVERAQRVPLSLTKGRFQRPLEWSEVMEMLEPLRRTPA